MQQVPLDSNNVTMKLIPHYIRAAALDKQGPLPTHTAVLLLYQPPAHMIATCTTGI
jgi:hypothetical protein